MGERERALIVTNGARVLLAVTIMELWKKMGERGRGQESWWIHERRTSVVALIKAEYTAGDFFLFLMMVLTVVMSPDVTT